MNLSAAELRRALARPFTQARFAGRFYRIQNGARSSGKGGQVR